MKHQNKPILLVGINEKASVGSNCNSGNFIHGHAARKFLNHYEEYNFNKPWTVKDIEYINHCFSRIVVIGANAIRIGVSDDSVLPLHKVYSHNIESTKIPVSVFSIGAQNTDFSRKKVSIPPSTKRYLNVLSDRSKSIGVRGEYTATILNSIGIKNTKVIGCQSCFLSTNSTFPYDLNLDPQNINGKIAFNLTGMRKESVLLKKAMLYGWDWIGQQDQEVYNFVCGKMKELEPNIQKTMEKLGFSNQVLMKYLKKSFYKFFDAKNFLEHLKRYNFSFGTRFHGNMAALQAGVPALWLTHDSRTKELCDFLHLPNIPLKKALKKPFLEEFLQHADYSGFFKNYTKNYYNFINFLNENEIFFNK